METTHDPINETAAKEPTGFNTVQYREDRMRRIFDYKTEVLKKRDHGEAALGTVIAGLMGVTVEMDEFIEQALRVTPKMIERMQRLLPNIQAYLQATRQVDRLTQVALKVEASRRKRSTGGNEKSTKPR
jgi:uncharacterized membrane protein YheB (UPF0754 family)